MINKKTIIIISSIFVLVAALTAAVVFFINPRLLAVAEFKKQFPRKEHAYVYVVPKARKINDQNNFASKTLIDRKDISFSIPWKVEEIKENDSSISIDKKFLFIRSKVTNYLQLLESFDQEKQKKVLELLGKDTFKSNFAFHQAFLATSPDQINIFTSENKIRGMSIFLFLKDNMTPPAREIYILQNSSFKGFQFNFEDGSGVDIQITNQKEDKAYNLMFMSGISKEEIDYILSSIKIKA